MYLSSVYLHVLASHTAGSSKCQIKVNNYSQNIAVINILRRETDRGIEKRISLIIFSHLYLSPGAKVAHIRASIIFQYSKL